MKINRAVSVIIISLFALTIFSTTSFAADPLAPASGSYVNTLTPVLTWSADRDATKYDLWLLVRLKNFGGFYMLSARFIREAGVTSLKINEGILKDSSDYMWAVRTVTAKNKLGSFGKSAKFSTRLSSQPQQPETPPAGDTSTVAGLIALIKQKFDIMMENGTSSWTLSALQQLYSTLTKLPASFYSSTKFIQRITTASFGPNIAGYVSSDQPSRVFLTDGGVNWDVVGVTVHEMAHTFQFNNYGVALQWATSFWTYRNAYTGQPTYVSAPPTEYGKTNFMEDMAESVMLYYKSPSTLKSNYADRYEFIRSKLMNGKEF